MKLAATTSFTPNILSYVYAAAGLTTYTAYHERFRHTLREEDIDFLRTLAPNFRGRPPMAEGPLFLPLPDPEPLPRGEPRRNPRNIRPDH